MEHPSKPTGPAATRWGAGLLALGALAYLVAVVAFVALYGQPEGTGAAGQVTLADRVAHYQAGWRLAHGIWLVETAAALLIAVAGFTLQGRDRGRTTRIPHRVAWGVVGVGGVVLTLMYAVMLGGYPAAATAFGDAPAAFAVVDGLARALFSLGNGVVFLGLAGAFAAEWGPEGAVGRGVAATGLVLCLLGAAAAAAMLAGVQAMAAAAPLALVIFLITAYLGLAIRRTA